MFDFHRQMALDKEVNPWSRSSYVAPEMSSAGLAQSTGSPGDCGKLTSQVRKVFHSQDLVLQDREPPLEVAVRKHQIEILSK